MRRVAFTLVELLIVVAIVSLLLAILMPSLGAARRQARRTVCASNLAQLARAFHAYAAENRGRAMPLALVDKSPMVYWWGAVLPARVDPTRGLLWPYVRSALQAGSVFECPSQGWGTYLAQPTGISEPTSTYGYNGYFLSPAHTPGWSLTIGRRPWQNIDALADSSRIFAFADTMLDLGGSLRNNALLDPPMIFQGGGRWRRNTNPTTSFRHDGSSNIAHVDGHVAAYPPAESALTSREHAIGSVGSENGPHYVPDWQAW